MRGCKLLKVLRLAAGLGNQMFQYALYLQMQKMYTGEKIYIDTMYHETDNYPREIERIFNLDFSEYDIYWITKMKYGTEFDKALDELKIWKKFGLSCMNDFSKDEIAWSYITSLSYKELPEIYEKFGFHWDEIVLRQTVSLKEFEENYSKKQTSKYLNTTKIKALAKEIIRNQRLQQWIGVCLNPYSRKRLLKQIMALKKPDGCGYEGVERVKTDKENVYFGLYGNPNDCVGIGKELRKTFRFAPFADERNLAFSKAIEKYNSVSIHMRLAHKQYGYDSIGGTKYYRKAVKYIKKKVVKPVFFVFSDDIRYCKKHVEAMGLAMDDRIIYVEGNKGDNSYRDMQLMSLCKHNIVPNSTFSWWGAFLNENPDKIVVTPFRTWPGTVSF